MVEPNNNLMICRNGHQQPSAGAKFCIYCGAAVGTQASTPPISTARPQQPPPFISPAPFAPPRQQNSQTPFEQIGQPQFNENFSPLNVNQQQIAPYPNQQIAAPIQASAIIKCSRCGGDGQRLAPQIIVCPQCRWLRPLAPGYAVDCSAFQWSEDGKAMSALRSIKPLTMVAQAISDKVGRRWIESTFNAVRLGEKQLPEIYETAVRAARILGMPSMPEVYISGEVMWDCRTFGSHENSFVIIGSALAMNFREQDLLFLFAREMGHCRAGHALWKTVIKFLMGDQGPRKGLMGNGLFGALGTVLSPTALVEGAIEMPLLAWARQAEITADRAGLLAVGEEEIARRVLLSWTLKSVVLYRQINVEAWLEQQAAGDDGFTKLSELTTSSTPYITRRLKVMEDFAAHSDLKRWQTVIRSYPGAVPPAPKPVAAPNQQPKPQLVQKNPSPAASIPTAAQKNAPVARKPTAVQDSTTAAKPASQSPPKANGDLRIKCSACQTPLRVPSKILEGKQQISVRCPNKECGKVIIIKKQSNNASSGNKTPAPMPEKIQKGV
ncbi:MAG: M48 family metallopeptidase [Pyrinomonadaceae bacterium]